MGFPGCNVIRSLVDLPYLSFLSYLVLKESGCTHPSFLWLWFPVVLPTLLIIHFVDYFIDVWQLSLVLGSNQMAFTLDVIIEVLIVVVTHLTVVVVRLWLRNRNYGSFFVSNTFTFRTLSDFGNLELFERYSFDFSKSFNAINLLVKSLAGIHSSRSVDDKVVNVILALVVLG